MENKKNYLVGIYIKGIKLPIENKIIQALNTCSALIIMGGEVATNPKYANCKQILIKEQEKINCPNCHSGCPYCGGCGYILQDVK